MYRATIVEAWAVAPWCYPCRKLADCVAEIVSVETTSLSRDTQRVGFREKRVEFTQQADPNSLRRIREIQERRVADCSKRMIATVSRAVFSDGDTLIDYHALRPQQAEWTSALPEQAVFDRVCGRGRDQ